MVCPLNLSRFIRSRNYSNSLDHLSNYSTERKLLHLEYSVKAEGDSPFEGALIKLSANILRRFFYEQRNSLNDLKHQLNDQRALLNSIWEEVTFYKSEFQTRKHSVGNAAITSSQKEGEAIANEPCEEKNVVQVSFTRTALFDRTSENGGPEKSSKDESSPEKNQFEVRKFQHPPWPEWSLFLDHLRPYTSLKEWKPKEESSIGDIFDDTAHLKHALVKFAQTHETALRTLSRKDLLMVVQHEFPSMDERTAAGKRLLKKYLEEDESSVTYAKLTDVVRLIYRAVRSAPSLDGAFPSELKSALIHLLHDLNSASRIKLNGITSQLDKTLPVSSVKTDGTDQKVELETVDETGRSGDIVNMVDGEAVLRMKSPSMNQDESTLKNTVALALSELPKFGSLKERVDARRARLAKESLEKEATKSLERPPLLTKELDRKTIKASSAHMDKPKNDLVVVRNFKAFDAIIESDDSHNRTTSKSHSKPVSSASLPAECRKRGIF